MAYEVIASQAGLEPLLLALVLLGSTAAFAEFGLLARGGRTTARCRLSFTRPMSCRRRSTSTRFEPAAFAPTIATSSNN